jgi:hypothetical protein
VGGWGGGGGCKLCVCESSLADFLFCLVSMPIYYISNKKCLSNTLVGSGFRNCVNQQMTTDVSVESVAPICRVEARGSVLLMAPYSMVENYQRFGRNCGSHFRATTGECFFEMSLIAFTIQWVIIRPTIT